MSFPLPGTIDCPVVVYLTPWCPYCTMALRLLTDRGIAHHSVDVSGDGDARSWLRSESGQHTVPQIFVAGRSIGGFDDLSALDRGGELQVLLAR